MAWYQWLTLFLLLYALWRVAKVLHFYFREYYVLWNIAMGGTSERRRVNANVRLHVYVCKTELLDEVSVNELYNFLIRMMHTDVTIKEFHSVVLSYKFVVVCRERKDGSMRGVSLLSVDRRELNGMKYTLIRLGLSFFQNYYRGGPLLYYVCAYHVFRELIYHPFTPLYIIGKAFSYKSYLAMCHMLPRLYPRYDVEMTEFARNILNEYGNASKAPNEIYDTDTFVLKRERTLMKEGVAVLNGEDLNDPHIKFFVEHNPGWVKGHQMIVAGEVRWWYLIRGMWRILRRARRARKGKVKGYKQSRRYSFQNETAEQYSTVYSEVDLGGAQKNHVIFQEEEGQGNSCEKGEGPDGEGGGRVGRLRRSYSRLYSYDVYQDL